MPKNDNFTFLAPRRKRKEVYSFDPVLAEALDEQSADDVMIPVEALRSLPFPAIYVEALGLRFFSWIESDLDDGPLELRFARVDEKLNCYSSLIHLTSGNTFFDSINTLVEEANEALNSGKASFEDIYANNAHASSCYGESLNIPLIRRMLQYVLYICADNAEIEESKYTKETYQHGATIHDEFRGIRKWDVGRYIAATISQHSKPSNNAVSRFSASKRPHIRRGHWNHYLIGKEKSQKLIVRWIAPIYVNADDDGEAALARIIPIR